jgi:hypothetical protein
MRFTRVLIPSITLLVSTLPSFAQSPPDSPDKAPPPPPGERAPGGPGGPDGPRGPGGPGGPGFGRPMLDATKARLHGRSSATAARRVNLDEAQTTKVVDPRCTRQLPKSENSEPR